ncbi:hypothetical protein [Pedobacter heparinus]|uniref:hypothetical protein n=1 Tax=Pedobacter heparinus TaxID=984 RepID=UPI00292ECB62|nr:hypothetical protein [Pedobacter heparinus]
MEQNIQAVTYPMQFGYLHHKSIFPTVDDMYVSSFPPYPEVKADESFQLTVFVDDKFTRKDVEQLFISLNNKVNIITL